MVHVPDGVNGNFGFVSPLSLVPVDDDDDELLLLWGLSGGRVLLCESIMLFRAILVLLLFRVPHKLEMLMCEPERRVSRSRRNLSLSIWT